MHQVDQSLNKELYSLIDWSYNELGSPECGLGLGGPTCEEELESCAETLDLQFSVEPALLTAHAIENSRNIIELSLYLLQHQLIVEVILFPSEELSLLKWLLAVGEGYIKQFICKRECFSIELWVYLGIVFVSSKYRLSSIDCAEDCCIEEVEILYSLRMRTDCTVEPIVVRERFVLLGLVHICEMSGHVHVNRSM